MGTAFKVVALQTFQPQRVQASARQLFFLHFSVFIIYLSYIILRIS